MPDDYKVEDFYELRNWIPPKQDNLIEYGILLPETKMLYFGPAKLAWKSNLAIHTAYCLAKGIDWFGFKTAKCLPYTIQIESPKALFRERMIKYGQNDQMPRNMLFTTTHNLKIDTSWGLAHLLTLGKRAQDRFPDLSLVFILDPMYKIMAGKLTEDYDIRRFEDNIDEARVKLGAAFIIIHHPRLTRVSGSGEVIDLGAEEMFGSSMLMNWADTIVKIKSLNPMTGKDHVRLSFDLCKNTTTLLPDLELRWSRATLQPTVLKRSIPEESEEVSVRNIEQEK